MRNSGPVAILRWALPFVFALVSARADPPKEVLQVVTDATDALANNDAKRFLDLVDSRMPGYESLYAEVHYMVAAEDEIDSSVEIVSDKGAGSTYELELDWVLQFGMDPPRRAIVKCRIERQGRAWKITSLAPVEFFKV
ncbi:MAG TPA: hypothetical protein VN841_22265 [Bryobacteraceae bacterium]|nr:hypothetical protein [Bryobacteraceae bacterium]